MLLLSVASFALVACQGTLTPIGDGDGDGDTDAAAVSAGEMLYRSDVEPVFTATRPGGTCESCHRTTAVGPQFLGANAAAGYLSIIADARFLSATGAASLLVTKGSHSDAQALCTGAGTPTAECTIDEVSIVAAWVDAEIAASN